MSATALLFAASAGAMMAQEGVSVSIDRFFIAPGGTATVYVNMDNDVDVSSVTGTIVLPEGLSFVSAGEGNAKVCAATERSQQGALVQLTGTETVGKLLVTDSKPLSGNSGAFFSFDVEAAEELPATSQIALSGFKGARGTEAYVAEESRGMAVNEDNKITLSMADVTVAPGEKTTLSVNLANTAELQNLQCDITMPAGLAIDTESLAATERLNDTYSFRTATLADGRVRVILYTMSQNAVQRVISGNEGALFTFGVTATEELPETANIKISKIVAASPEAVGYYGEDALVGVTNSALTGISGVEAQGRYSEEIYTVGGVRTETTKQGVNIIRKEDGTVVKVYKK